MGLSPEGSALKIIFKKRKENFNKHRGQCDHYTTCCVDIQVCGRCRTCMFWQISTEQFASHLQGRNQSPIPLGFISTSTLDLFYSSLRCPPPHYFPPSPENWLMTAEGVGSWIHQADPAFFLLKAIKNIMSPTWWNLNILQVQPYM